MDDLTNANNDVQIAVDHEQNVITNKRKYKDNSKYYNGDFSSKIFLSDTVIASLKIDISLQLLMTPLGYDQDKIVQFEQVFTEAKSSISNQNMAKVQMQEVYRLFLVDFTSATLELRYLIKVTRVALRDAKQKIEMLQLDAKRGKSKADSFSFMESFYAQVLADTQILAELARYGYTKEKIESCRNLALAAKNGHNNYYKARALANESTRVQNQKIAELDKWMSEYNTLYKVALAQKG